jgi:hypothetical protein
MNKEIDIKVKANDKSIPNKMHLEVQLNTHANVFVPKKGKGSFKRNQKHKNDEQEDD